MRFLFLSSFAAVLLFITGCVSTDYVGQSYAPTERVDVFYSMADVDRPHAVMGKITASAMDGWDSELMVDELKTQAMARGADALVIEDVHTETTGSYTSTYGNDDGPEWVITEDGKLKHNSTGTTSSTSITTDTREKVMSAELVKYE